MDDWNLYVIDEKQSERHRIATYTQQLRTNEARLDIFVRNESESSPRMRRLIEGVYEAIQNMLGHFQPNSNEQLSLIIEGRLEDGQQTSIGYHRQSYTRFTVEYILDVLVSKLNSAQTLQGDFILIWTYYPETQFTLLGNNHYAFRGDWQSFIAAKQSIVQIHPEHDPFQDECFEQFLGLGLALCAKETQMDFSSLHLRKSTYSDMTQENNERKFITRHKFVDRLRGQFYSILEHGRIPLSFCTVLEQKFPIRFCLWGYDTQGLHLIYPSAEQLPYAEEKYTIYGICKGSVFQSFTHVDFICNADALDLFPQTQRKKSYTGHVCRKCFQFYLHNPNCQHSKNGQNSNRKKGKKQHKQIESCPRCHTCDGVEREADIQGFLKESIPPTPHCPCCKKEQVEIGDGHECFLPRRKMKKPHQLYAVYDFECCVDEKNRHIPYCVTCCFPYGLPKLDVLKQKYPYQIVQNQVVFVFWGLHTLQFWDFLTEDALRNVHFYAHNARAYDSILIKSYLWTQKQWVSEDIARGRKFLQVSYPKMELVFKDSLSFIPTSLRKCSSEFGIDEFRKGHFPHKWMTANQFIALEEKNGIWDHHPAAHFFETDFRDEDDCKEAVQWIHQFTQQSGPWNAKQDAIEYCISDTLLLSETLKRFRAETMHMCETVERPQDCDPEPFDPFVYTTLASAMMEFYLSQCLPLDTIACIDRYQCIQQNKERAWMYSIGKATQICSEWNNISISGIDHAQHVIYRYYSCERYGCMECFPKIKQGQYHPRLGCTYEQARQRNERQNKRLTEEGWTIVECWEHEFDLEQCNPLTVGIDPREAYKGGKTELYKLRVPGTCSMVDFVSQYPTVCYGESADPLSDQTLTWDLPTGYPQKQFYPAQYNWNKDCLGVAKIWICPPQHLWIPFLSHRICSANELEVLYGCCKICMEQRLLDCTHTREERAFIGTWTLSEIRYALSLGYEILQIIEVWEYPEKSHTLFRSFITPFMYNKIVSKSSGLVDENGQYTDKGRQVAEYLYSILNRPVEPHEFSNHPSRRTTAKLIQNAFTGKWGQRDTFHFTRSFTKEDSWHTLQLLHDPNVRIHSAVLLDDDCVTLECEPLSSTSLRGISKKNDHIVAHITAYGRTMLHRVEMKLGKKMVYVDTDSAYHQTVSEPVYQTGFRTGDLELECPVLENWVGLARKSYSYEAKGKPVMKQKGIAMKQSFMQLFQPQSLHQLVLDTKQKWDDLQVDENEESRKKRFKQEQPSLKVIQVDFRTLKESLGCLKETLVHEKETRFSLLTTKRKICWNQCLDGIIDTVPFGYQES
jgi:hypothetical protein